MQVDLTQVINHALDLLITPANLTAIVGLVAWWIPSPKQARAKKAPQDGG